MAARRKTTRSVHRARSASPRVIWRGAITFGLVHVPVTLYPATRAHALDLDLIDKQVIDLVAQLKKSLRGGKGAPEKAPARAARRARHARSNRRVRGRHAA